MSPVGWYAVTYAHVFIRVPKMIRGGETACVWHENTALIKANSPAEAYDRCVTEMPRLTAGNYNDAFDESIRYKGRFGGIIEVEAMFETPSDMAEVLNRVHTRSTVERVSKKFINREEVIPRNVK